MRLADELRGLVRVRQRRPIPRVVTPNGLNENLRFDTQLAKRIRKLKVRAKNARYWAKIKNDPARRAQSREYFKAWAKNNEVKRKASRSRWLKRNAEWHRAYQREWMRKHRAAKAAMA